MGLFIVTCFVTCVICLLVFPKLPKKKKRLSLNLIHPDYIREDETRKETLDADRDKQNSIH